MNGRIAVRGLALVPLLALVLGVVWCAGPAGAQETRDAQVAGLLTLEEAIGEALSRHRRVRAAELRRDAAEQGLEIAESRWLPRLDVEAGVQRTDNPVLVFSQKLLQESFTENDFALRSLNSPDARDDWMGRLSLRQPVWAGGRIAGARDEGAERLASAEAMLDSTRQQVVREVTDLYASAVLAQRRLDVAETSLETAEAHVLVASDLFAGGLVVESDVLLAKVRLGEIEEMRVRARTDVDRSRVALNLALGRPSEAALVLPDDIRAPSVDPVRAAVESDSTLADLVERAHRQRPDLSAARHRTVAEEAAARRLRRDRWPEVGLEASYETHAEDFFGSDGDNYALGLGLRLPIFDGGESRARARAAELGAASALEDVGLLEDRIELEVRSAAHELEAARERVRIALTAVELGERSLEIVEDRYSNGLTTASEVLDAQTALVQARFREVAARRDELLARTALDLATGDL